MVDEIVTDVYDITVRETDEGARYRTYLVRDEVPTLIDTALEDTADILFERIGEIGTTPERLVITHGDPDHMGGFDAVVDRYDCETWVPTETDTSDLDATPDHRFADGDTIGSFEAVHTPGHEPDNYSLVDETAEVVIAGDAVFGSDFRGLPTGYLLPPAALYSENLNRAEASIEKLLDYEFDAVLVFHGSSVPEGGRDRLDAFINFPGKPGWATYE